MNELGKLWQAMRGQGFLEWVREADPGVLDVILEESVICPEGISDIKVGGVYLAIPASSGVKEAFVLEMIDSDIWHPDLNRYTEIYEIVAGREAAEDMEVGAILAQPNGDPSFEFRSVLIKVDTNQWERYDGNNQGRDSWVDGLRENGLNYIPLDLKK